MKNWSSAMWSEFALLMSSELDKKHPMYFNMTKEEREQILTDYRRDFIGQYGETLDTMDMQGAFSLYKSFIEERIRTTTNEPRHNETLSFTLRANYGAVACDWGASAVFSIENGNDRRRAYNALYEITRVAREEYERANGVMADSRNNAPTNDVMVADALRLAVNVVDGQFRYRLMAEPFTKFGVPVYPEVLERSGIDRNAIPIAGLDLTGKRAHILMQGGKPAKVTKIE